MDVVLLSRAQFALTVMFHYLFPPLTIGMGLVLVSLDWKWLRTGDPLYEQAARFWTRIFALNFAIGVATGIVMEFEFGTNWATYSRFLGDVFGSALAAEGIFAFFLESGFLAVLVFGGENVSENLVRCGRVVPTANFAPIHHALGNAGQSTQSAENGIIQCSRKKVVWRGGKGCGRPWPRIWNGC